MKNITIYFDMDGTIADLYGVENWLDFLINEKPTPYVKAKPLCNLRVLARKLNILQKKGVKIGIISWLSKNGSEKYNEKVTKAKLNWLKKHLNSVKFDKIIITPYGTPKEKFTDSKTLNILFDDEKKNRENWEKKENNIAFDEKQLIKKIISIENNVA